MISLKKGFQFILCVQTCVSNVILVDEDVSAGTVVTDVSLDIPLASSFQLYKDSSLIRFQASHFAINESGVIRTNASLDYEDVRLRRMQLFVIGSVGDLNVGHNLTVILRDSNDNAPYFVPSLFYGFVGENADVGTNVSGIPLLRAYDRDSSANGVMRYELVNSSDWFQVTTIPQSDESPVLRLKTRNRIDRELNQSVDVLVKAVDSGGLSATATVRVTIVDENDNAPQFAASMKNAFQIPENARIGQSVFQARATDIDYGINARVYYSLAVPVLDFSCHPETGVVSVARALDYETTTEYSLTVRATDRGIPAMSSEKNVSVNVVNSNEHAPVFLSPTMPVMIVNNAPLGFTVARVELADDDAVIDEAIELEITDGDPVGYFQVGPSKKVSSSHVFPLLLRRELNKDPDTLMRFFLTLVARDAGHPQLWSKSRLTIAVTRGVDDFQFDKTVYEVDINENSPFGTLVVWASAGTSPTTTTTYTFSQTPAVTKFRIGRSSGLVTVREALDREVEDFYNLTVEATRASSQPVHSTILVKVLDANDNTPQFTKSSYSIAIPEDAGIGQWLPVVKAMDKDTGTNGDIRFRIISSTAPSLFTMNEFNGAIAPAVSLDYEATGGQSIGFTVRAEDQGRPLHRSADAQVLVSVRNVNDNAPSFVPISYSCIIPEEDVAGILCVQLNVNDLDGLSFSSWTFSIVGGDPANDFMVDSSGRVMTTRALDREMVPSYVLSVAVNDGQNEGVNHATVTVTVSDISDSTPQFSRSVYNLTVEDNLAVDSLVATVHADTDDIGINAMITYSFQSTLSPFQIDPYWGDVRLSGDIDASRVSHYTGIVSALGPGTSPKSATAMIIINVIPGNTAPYFDSGPIDRRVVSTSVGVGSTVATVQASEQDAGDTITYSLTKPSREFSLDGGNIKTSVLLRNGTEYSVSITATDSGTTPKQANLTVFVSAYAADMSSDPLNGHRPVFQQSHYGVRIAEGSSPKTVLLTVSATDGDSPSLSYSIIDVLPSSGNSLFGISSKGVIGTQAVLDREVAAVYFLTVLASNTELSSRCSVTVIVDDQNDEGPVILPSYDVDVHENVPVGTRIFTFHNADPDVGTNVQAMFLPEGVTRNFFRIDPSHGDIYTAKPLDLEATDRPPSSITVRAEDTTISKVTRTTINFHYLDANDNSPTFQPASYLRAIPEDFIPGTSILTLSAADADSDKTSNGRVTYHIVSGNEGGVFYIDDTTGVMSSQASLDYEQTQTYSLQIQARDHGRIPRTAMTAATVRVSVVNANDFAPMFQFDSYSVDIDTSVGKGAVIATVLATDQDLGLEGIVRYQLTGSSDLDINSTTAKITLLSDSPKPGRIVATVKATDQGAVIQKRNSTEVILAVNVVGPNKAPVLPTAAQTLKLDETQETGVVVTSTAVKSLVTDSNAGYAGVVLFAITDGNDDARFNINSETGDIVLLNELNRENDEKYSLTITASDLGNPVMTATIKYTIEVLDVNDNVPQFSLNTPFQLNVSEGAAIGTLVGTASASDDDTGTNGVVRYRIANDVLGHFRITEDTGHLQVNGTLDRELQAAYRVVVEAYDLGTPKRLTTTVSVDINIDDVADSAPICNPDHYDVVLYEDYHVGSLVVRIQCIELDDVSVSYDLLSGNTSYWNIDPMTGIVRLKARIAASDEAPLLSIAATNSMARTLSSVVVVNVSVIREERNLHWPVFTSVAPMSGVLFGNASVGFSVLQLVAVDSDSGPEGAVEYSIVSGNGIGKFAVDSSSGLLSVVSQLGHEVLSEYMLTVVARDQGSYPKSSQLTLIITVTGVNNQPPIFPGGSSSVSLTETPVSGLFVTVTAAYDPDRRASIHYSILSGSDDNDFAIESTSGMITTGSMGVDREKQTPPIHALTVQASDADQSVSTHILFVRLLDDDDNAPRFTKRIYNVTVYSTVRSGWPLLQLVASDDDSDQISAIGYSTTSKAFSVDHTSGLVTAAGTLMPSTRHTLTVEASSGSPSIRADPVLVAISVIPPVQRSKRAANSKPIFDVRSVMVREDERVGAQVTSGSVATDPDGDILMFQIDGWSSSDAVVAVYPNTGILYLRLLVDREVQDSYYFNVSVFDGHDVAREVITMRVTDSNDNWPVFNGPFDEMITENMHPASIVINASDADAGNNSRLHYWIDQVVTPVSSELFRVLPESNVLITRRPLDREEADQHVLIVCAEDMGRPRKQNCTQVVINVQDINDNAPEFASSRYTALVPENVLPGYHILTVSAVDRDVGDNSVVQFRLESSENIPFLINRTTGDLTVSQHLDFERKQSYNFAVVSMDQGSPSLSSNATVYVLIQDVHDSGPVWMQDTYSSNIVENGPAGLSVVTVSVLSTGPVTYNLVNDPIEALVIDANSGIVTTSRPLDREAMPAFNVSIRACDLQNLCSNATLLVTVGDVNDNDPQFLPSNQLTYDVSEGIGLGHEVCVLSVQDPDVGSNAEIEFSFVGQRPPQFTISANTGQVIVETSLDREATEQISFQVEAKDMGRPRRATTAEVVLTVLDVNDNSPRFTGTRYTQHVTIPVPVGYNVIRPVAQDPDDGLNGEVVYSILSGLTDGKLTINSSSGLIAVVENYDLMSMYQLLVQATDGGGLHSAVQVMIHFVQQPASVQFANVLYDETVMENLPANEFVVMVIAEDFLRATSSHLRYSLASPTTDFQVNYTTGVITTTKSLDRETVSQYHLVVQAEDESDRTRLAHADVDIVVVDVNDNSPLFPKETYEATVRDDTVSGTGFTRVEATDADAGANGDVVYSITTQTTDKFEINSRTGLISTTTSLDRTGSQPVQHTLSILASDQGIPPRNDSAVVYIYIVDVDAPQFNATSYAVSVKESASKGDVVARLTAASVSERKPKYTIVSGDDDRYFSMDPDTGVITVSNLLDFERVPRYHLQVRASDTLASALFAEAMLNVTVIDVNDNDPIFSGAVFTASVEEDIPIGSVLLVLTATDKDSGSFGDVRYFLKTVNSTQQFDDLFDVHPQSGNLSNIKSLDREQHEEYRFTVIAEDSGHPPRSSEADVRIRPLNVNDNRPLFQQGALRASVDEDATSGTTITTIQASDDDGDAVTYSLVGGDGKDDFHLDKNSGVLILVVSKLTGLQYDLLVFATDGLLTTTANLTIEVLDVNDNQPVFNSSEYLVHVAENQKAGTFVVQVFATDDDSGTNGELNYEFAISSKEFSVDQMTGKVYTTGENLNREASPFYRLKVKATDGGGDSAFADVLVTLIDVNDEIPKFQLCSGTQSCTFDLTVSEAAVVGDIIVTVSAADKDVGTNAIVTYSIANATDSMSPFQINNATGDLTLTRSLDFETIDKFYKLDILAVDHGQPPLTGQLGLAVSITDVQDTAPQFTESVYQATVPENAKVRDSVVTVCAGDATMGGVTCPSVNRTVSYTIVRVLFGEKPTRVHYFRLNASSGLVTVRKVLPDLFVAPNHTIVVQARYSDSIHSNFAHVQVGVLDINNNDPIWVSATDYTGSVLENKRAGQIVVAVSAQDADVGTNADLRYYLKKPGSVPFDIDPVTGLINTTRELDRENKPQFVFDIYAEDRGSPSLRSAFKRVIINVDDENDNPPTFDQKLYVTDVLEDAFLADRVITVSATDDDIVSRNKLQYTITGGNSGGAFSIKRSTGEITVVALLDRETTALYVLNVSVFDSLHTTVTTVTILVLDVNDNPPLFQGATDVLVSEDKPVGSVVLSVSATDADIGMNAVVEYSLSIQTPFSVFGINASTGDITVQRELDYENTTDYRLTIEAVNPNNLNMKDVISVRVKVEDVNDNAPLFAPNLLIGSVEENLHPGSVVRKLTATDRDSGSNGKITYSLVNDANSTFSIESDTGLIKTALMLDRETQEYYDLIIQAVDGGRPSLSSNASVIVKVVDVNDNSPEFSVLSYNASLLEDSSTGKPIVTVTALDRDKGSNAQVTYGLINPSDFPNFRVDSKTGEIILSQQVDYESVNFYNVTVQATDGGFPIGSSSANVLINVLDVNDNSPAFEGLPYTATVPEDVAIGFVVFNPTGSDRDSSSNAELYYTIKVGNIDKHFSINESTGAIKTSEILDRETRDTYELRVEVRDGGSPSMSADVAILFIVLDVNDNSPTFKPSTYRGEVQENFDCTGDVLVQLSADDPDLGSSGTESITFSLSDGNELGLFALRGNQILCNSTFDREELSEYVLTVTASDKGDPSLTSSTTVVVVISDVNDNSPVAFARSFLVNYIDQFVGPIGQVGIYDPDDDGKLTYSIILGDISTFNVNPTTGTLFAIRSPVNSDYLLNVTGTQQGTQYDSLARIFVQPVNEEMRRESVTLRLEGMSPTSFIGQRYRIFRHTVGEILNIDQASVLVLSVQSVPSYHGTTVIDVVFAASHGKVLYQREYIQSEAFVNRTLIETRLGLSLLAVTIDNCVPEACQNRGTCRNVFMLGDNYDAVDSDSLWMQSLNQFRDFNCSCVPRFYDKVCDQGHVDFCHSSPCLHGARCINGNRSFTCDCPANVTGDVCQFKQNYCESLPCINGGVCVDQPETFSCTCPTDYTGRRCEQSLFSNDRCTQGETMCNHGLCTSGPYDVTCTCDMGFNGTRCEMQDQRNVNLTCAQNPCQYGGTCTQKTDKYECICPLGFNGDNCEIDIDECSQSPCHNSGRCIDGQGGYKCICDVEYTGRMCETEVSPCEVPRCADDRYCVPDASSSGFNCVDLCETFVCNHGGTCHQRGAETWCMCLDKWSGDHCELTRASFTDDSFIMFPSLDLRRSGQLSLQFVTMAGDALLLFNGRYDHMENDFLAVEVIGGKLALTYSVGQKSGALVQIPRSQNVDDGVWHSLDIEWQDEVGDTFCLFDGDGEQRGCVQLVKMTLDGCRRPLVTHTASGDSLDRSNCYSEGRTTGNFR